MVLGLGFKPSVTYGDTGDELNLAKTTVEALEKLSDADKGFTIWDNNSHTVSNGNFQIGTITLAGLNHPVMRISFHFFSANGIDSRFLWRYWPVNGIKIFNTFQVTSLNTSIYNKIRDSIKEKLGSQANDLIESLNIS